MPTICPVCTSDASVFINKKGYDYYQCQSCKTVFVPGGIEQGNMVGGGYEFERNTTQNDERIRRFFGLVGSINMLDFGCGHGMLVAHCNSKDILCDGYDKWNPDFNKLQDKKYNLISMVEVIEHTSAPFSELDDINDMLSDNGILYIETSFVDIAEEEVIPLSEFFYIEPSVGHCTLFSHASLDILMRSKGFTPLVPIDRNTRIYQKNKKMITLITPTQGNPIALKRTIDSFKGIVNEVIVGSVCVFPEDEEKIMSYGSEIFLKLIKLPFNYIFKNGFSATLNTLASYASNDWVMYMNVGEVIHSGKEGILSKLSNRANCYYIDHPTELHHWYRVYNRTQLQWGGIIHEEVTGNRVADPTPLFTFDDTPKDDSDPIYAKAMNSIKELVYFNQYLKLVDQPHLIGNTNAGWVQFARDGFHSFIDRMHKKGDLYEAFILGDYEMMTKYFNSEEFKNHE